MRYNIIYADPPWHYGSKSAVNNTKGSDIKPLSEHYITMKLAELKKLPIEEIALDDCACFMWVTDSHLDEGIELLRAWGFSYKTIAFNWIKLTSKGNFAKNVAPWTMKSSEICLLGIRGRMQQYKIANNIDALILAERTKHSQKPEEARKRIIDIFGDLPKIELFARKTSPGWDVWGNEVEGSTDIENKPTQ